MLRGETTATAPAEYVAGLFDGYAERVGRGKNVGWALSLGTYTPQKLAGLLPEQKQNSGRTFFFWEGGWIAIH